jgi:dipeptidyl aminopeptidase/acylaminoacyl peptidase
VLGSDETELQANSPVNVADHIKAKVMLVHGARDERVPIKHAEVMRAALRKAGNEPQWYVEGDEAHGFVKESANEQLYTRVDGFLRSCLN